MNCMDPFFPLEANAGQFLSLLVACRNIKTRRRSEIKNTRSRTKQDFSEEALSKQNTEAQLASLSYSSFQATTEWSAIFAQGVLLTSKHFLLHSTDINCLQDEFLVVCYITMHYIPCNPLCYINYLQYVVFVTYTNHLL